MARLRTATAAALAAALLGAGAPPAPAADDSHFYGSCGFDTAGGGPALPPDTWTGTVDAVVALYSSTHGNVVNATVTCELRVDGVTQVATSGSGTGAVVIADTLTFHATDVQHVQMCTTVDFTSDWTPTRTECQQPTTTELPPNWISNVIDHVLRLLASHVYPVVDPPLCAAFAAAVPGAGPISIDGSGDVSAWGELLWDCPPYATPLPTPPPDTLPDLPVPTNFTGVSGAGYNDGSAGFLTLFEKPTAAGVPQVDTARVVSTCGFTVNAGVVTVTGRTDAPGADATRIGCRLEDAHTGTVLYDEPVTATGATAVLRDSFAATGPLAVCTEGAAWFGTRQVSLGRECRPGVAV